MHRSCYNWQSFDILLTLLFVYGTRQRRCFEMLDDGDVSVGRDADERILWSDVLLKVLRKKK